MTPLLSILTPTFQGMPFLENALRSTHAATRSGVIEHIVSDGGSTDGSTELLSASHTRWQSRSDSGQSEALNTAFADSSGSWIGWLNCDEFYLDGVLDRIVDLIRRDDCDLVFGDYIEVQPDTSALRLVTQHAVRPTVLDHFGLSLPSCTAFFRRDFVEANGGFDQASKTMMDWDLWLHIQRQGGRFRYTGRAHAGFTRRDEQASTRYAALVVEENARLDVRYGIRSTDVTRGLARGERLVAKAANGSYLRQARFARRLRSEGGAVRIGPVPHRDAAADDLLAPFVLR